MFLRQLLLNLVIQEVVKTIVLCQHIHTFGSMTMVANTLLLSNILRKILPQLLPHSFGLYKTKKKCVFIDQPLVISQQL